MKPETIIKQGMKLIDRFDFNKVHSLMVINKWHYAGEKEAPTADRLRALAIDLLYTLSEYSTTKANRVGTGGLRWNFYVWEYHTCELELTFNFESACTTFREEV